MEDRKIIIEKMKKIKSLKDEDQLRYEMYSFFTNLILSKEEFKFNKDIKEFLENFNMEFKKYVLDSRTLVLARTLREIEKLDKDSLEKYKAILEKIYLKENGESMNANKKNNIKETDDYVSGILKKYSRNKRG
ncbi:hypothetical protein [Clostridium neonatale]|uniref:Uncharacterized protein n=1 Tax=Clostridium neonatale TaxID=137838 RepID=A0AAD1YBU1_9CLOT|nr:hypothetical protein [Clostridium neonatale]CAI3195047.1 conserved hypothetical protein [Clostridium neonatale]CAI3200194.1 conserved hypothetical protein [Clostridium neonatale]CAI3212818.1 conserved hypothetical protein [Clostridium neonatale]CAI3219445.1 conserved hypothetical protein [Clostridium neonatale]CAI3227862.1 conserved hypothetical protein [Clostridium neonatale]